MSNVILPSSEANFFDVNQSLEVRSGSGINEDFPNPVSGYDIYNTYPENPAAIVNNQSGLFNYNGMSGVFSNAPETQQSGIEDFSAFNSYIHYYRKSTPNNVQKNSVVKIPYISDSVVSETFNVYGN